MNNLNLNNDLHAVVRDLNNDVKQLNAAIEDCDINLASTLAKSVMRNAKIVVNEIDCQAQPTFNWNINEGV